MTTTAVPVQDIDRSTTPDSTNARSPKAQNLLLTTHIATRFVLWFHNAMGKTQAMLTPTQQ